jgi:hypothetical protein
MANWLKCTDVSGSEVFINFDSVTMILPIGSIERMSVRFVSGDSLELKGTLSELQKNGLKV